MKPVGIWNFRPDFEMAFCINIYFAWKRIDTIIEKAYNKYDKKWKAIRRDVSCPAEYFWHVAGIFTKKQMLAQPMPDKEILYCFFLSGLTSPEKEENEQYKEETGRIKRNWRFFDEPSRIRRKYRGGVLPSAAVNASAEKDRESGGDGTEGDTAVFTGKKRDTHGR